MDYRIFPFAVALKRHLPSLYGFFFNPKLLLRRSNHHGRRR
ncbi:hypothetical protein CCACVL1_01108 [Corchorus capsularis]|uniref:Uncharacterized protein n=1 Tax=Corchorus capsularis TaxID=210143 RepID=A0A1R3KN46_COCAP|nr:hypothetical protein CCACVL1_01108 [Corchorus capsularis]